MESMTAETLRLEWIDPADLQANPANWRKHPTKQKLALKAAIAEVGWAGALLYNERTQRLIDGHARKEQFAGQPVPVLIGSWDEATEKKILATLDPLAAMAEADTDSLDKLLREVRTGDVNLKAMLDELASRPVITFDGPPQSVIENVEEIEEIKRQRKECNEGQLSKTDTERYLVIVYADREKKQEALRSLNLPEDERYLAAETVELKPRGIVRGCPDAKAAEQKKAGATG